jgi:concentrative nucleoside transporter, CNT family
MSWLNLLSLFGLFGLCGIAWLGSEDRRRMPWKVIAWGLGLQLILGLLVFQVPVTRTALLLVNDGINSILDVTEAGARFLFGNVLVPDPANIPGPLPAGRWIARAIVPAYTPVAGDRLSPESLNVGYIFAFRGLPLVIFFSALMSLLYNLGLIQPLVNGFAMIFRRTMGLSGAEALSGAANIFVGIEATLVVRPYLARMTRSELTAILASCFGSIASTVLALYSQLLRPAFPNITGHLVSASIMAIPACFVMAKILVPETEVPATLGLTLTEPKVPANPSAREAIAPDLLPDISPDLPIANPNLESPAALNLASAESTPAGNFADRSRPAPLDATKSPLTAAVQTTAIAHPQRSKLSPMESIVEGAMDGVKLAVAIAAVLIAILGLVGLVNLFFANLGSLSLSSNPVIRALGNAFKLLSLPNIFGFLFVPLTFLTGVSDKPAEVWQASQLVGRRFLETEIPAYLQLATLSGQGALSDRALVIISYVLCGFAHLPSVGIFVGGLIGLVPSRRKDITEVGWKALWAATLATLMIGCVAGVCFTGNAAVLGR